MSTPARPVGRPPADDPLNKRVVGMVTQSEFDLINQARGAASMSEFIRQAALVAANTKSKSKSKKH